MKTTTTGLFYIQFEYEAWPEAVERHVRGFESVEEAVDAANLESAPTPFVVRDSAGVIAYSGMTSTALKSEIFRSP